MVVLMKAGFCFSFLLFQFLSVAQFRVTFAVTRLPSYHILSEKIYLAGNFNNWNPGDEKMVLQSSGNRQTITIELPKGRYEYNFTRGDREKVECHEGGSPVAHRIINIEKDTVVDAYIEHWSDHFPKKPRSSSASKNVKIVDKTFYIPQLNRYRRVWIYLPQSYGTTRKNYPVLYMHDGQNVFDEITSAFGEWGVDEALDSLGPKHREVIVVAIDNGSEKRMNEYAPYDMEKYGKAEGNQYVDFLAKTLKPYIDKHYRTKKDEKNTFVAGSSMGGLISFYALLKYPKVFGGAGVFSPSFWTAPALKNITPGQAKKVKGRIYFYAGQNESESMVPDMLNVFEQMRRYSKATMKIVIRAEGRHNEASWREAFPLFYEWITQ